MLFGSRFGVAVRVGRALHVASFSFKCVDISQCPMPTFVWHEEPSRQHLDKHIVACVDLRLEVGGFLYGRKV